MKRTMTVKGRSGGQATVVWNGSDDGMRGRLEDVTGSVDLVKAIRERLQPNAMSWFLPDVGPVVGFDPSELRMVEHGLNSLRYGKSPVLAMPAPAPAALMKGSVPIGTVHTWADGHSYRKTADGWTPVEGAHTWHGKVGEKMAVPYGDGSQHATHYEIADERHHEGRDEVKITSHAGTPHGGSHGPWIPKSSARHFHDDLKGVVRGPKDAPHPAINAVLEGKAKFLGKGDDGVAFKAGDKVVKASTTVPFQPMNHGHLTPKAAANRLVHQGQVSEHLRGLGVPGLMPIQTFRHGDKSYQVRDHVEIPEKLSKEHLDQAAATVHAMHERGWKLGDDVQVGVHHGKAVLYDTGKATKMKHPDDRSWRGEREDDHSRLASLYKQHGHVYEHPDAGRRASDRWSTVVDKAMRADKNHDFHIRHLKEGLAAMVKAHGEGSKEAQSAQDEHDALVDMLKEHAAKGLAKGGNPGPYIGPQGGKWANPEHTIPWHVHVVTAHHDPQHAGKRVHLYHHPVTGRVHFQSADYAGNVGSFPPAALHITKHGVIERGTGAVLAVPEAHKATAARASITEDGKSFETGKEVSFPFTHRKQKTPNMGALYGQDKEPAGRYVVHGHYGEAGEHNEGSARSPHPVTTTHGHLTFKNPLVLHSHEDGQWADEASWKHRLSAEHGGKTGKALSRSVAKKGHDGIVTVDHSKHGSSVGEIVDLTHLHEKGAPMNKAGWLELPEAHGRWAYLAMLCKGRIHKYFKRVPTGKFTKTGRPKYRYFYHVARGGSIGAKDHMVVVTDKDGKTHGASFMADGGHWHITHADGDRLTVKHDESGETKEMSKDELAAKLYAEHGAALAQHAKDLSERTDRERAEVAEHGSDVQRTRAGLPTKAEEKAKADKAAADAKDAREREEKAKVAASKPAPTPEAAKQAARGQDAAPEDKSAKPKAKPVERDAAGDPKMATLDGKIEAVGDHIWGSRKDLANKRHIDSSKDLEGMGYTDAAAIVSKANLVTPLALEDAKAMGMSPGTAYMFMDLLGAIRQKPDDSAAGRAAYVDDIRSIQGAMARVKTVADFHEMIEGMRALRKNAPKYTTIATIPSAGYGSDRAAVEAKLEELRKDNPGVQYHVTRPGGYSQAGETRIVTTAPLPYDQLGAKVTGRLDGAKAARNDHHDAIKQASELDNGRAIGNASAGSWGVKRLPTHDGMEPDQAWAWLNASTAKDKEAVAKKKAAKPEANTERGFSEAKAGASRGPAVRIGGPPIPENASSDRVKSTFNLREVDYGKEGYMKQADRAYHTKALEGAMHDLSDALGLDPKALSFNGRLGVALGARGTGGMHGGAAHYETGRAVINLTKFAGGGSLAHEWGHALDNIIASHHIASSLGASDGDTYLTRTPEHSKMPKELSAHANAVVKAMFEHPDPVRARAEHAAELTKLNEVEGALVAKNNALVREHEALKRKPTTTEARDRQVAAKQKNVETWKTELQSLAAGKKSSDPVIQRMSNLTHWISQTNRDIAALNQGAVSGPEVHERMEAVKKEIEALRTPINRAALARRTMQKVSPTASVYAREAAAMDKGGKKPYWSSPHEMFARAFDTYVHAKLAAKGRKNTYLTKPHFDNGQPFPKGDEAAKIHAAMDGLFAYINKSGDLAKALRRLAGLDDLAKAFRDADGSWWVPTTVALGSVGCLADLMKGASHRYFRKVPTGNPRHPWRYYYRATAGGGMANQAHMQQGAAFKGTHNGQMGHFHIKQIHNDGHVTIHHDESGVTEKVHRDELQRRLEAEHSKAIEVEHKGKANRLDQQHAEAVKHGSPMQAAKLRADADKAHVAASAARKAGRTAEASRPQEKPSEPAKQAQTAARAEPQASAPAPSAPSKPVETDEQKGRGDMLKRYRDADDGKEQAYHFTPEQSGLVSHVTYTPGAKKGHGTVHVHHRHGRPTRVHENVPHSAFHGIVEGGKEKGEPLRRHPAAKALDDMESVHPDVDADARKARIEARDEKQRAEAQTRRKVNQSNYGNAAHWALTEAPTLLKALAALGRTARHATPVA